MPLKFKNHYFRNLIWKAILANFSKLRIISKKTYRLKLNRKSRKVSNWFAMKMDIFIKITWLLSTSDLVSATLTYQRKTVTLTPTFYAKISQQFCTQTNSFWSIKIMRTSFFVLFCALTTSRTTTGQMITIQKNKSISNGSLSDKMSAKVSPPILKINLKKCSLGSLSANLLIPYAWCLKIKKLKERLGIEIGQAFPKNLGLWAMTYLIGI